ncbi:hypothetical protein [Pseudooceanicola sp. MF1-13]|uniref:hypothetical protein n=1 Tax=Pseudooceanicola sp. MF1-13 TaxID=3379095 RepID=UPI003892270C
MIDPRKPVIRPDRETQFAMQTAVGEILIRATEVATQSLRITGATFVSYGMTTWLDEMAELDADACTAYLRATADIYDPNATDASRADALARRNTAMNKIFAAVDILNSKPGSTA